MHEFFKLILLTRSGKKFIRQNNSEFLHGSREALKVISRVDEDIFLFLDIELSCIRQSIAAYTNAVSYR